MFCKIFSDDPEIATNQKFGLCDYLRTEWACHRFRRSINLPDVLRSNHELLGAAADWAGTATGTDSFDTRDSVQIGSVIAMIADIGHIVGTGTPMPEPWPPHLARQE